MVDHVFGCVVDKTLGADAKDSMGWESGGKRERASRSLESPLFSAVPPRYARELEVKKRAASKRLNCRAISSAQCSRASRCGHLDSLVSIRERFRLGTGVPASLLHQRGYEVAACGLPARSSS